MDLACIASVSFWEEQEKSDDVQNTKVLGFCADTSVTQLIPEQRFPVPQKETLAT